MRPILAAEYSVNQRLPSGAYVIPTGTLSAVGMGNSVITPPGVIRPIWLPLFSVNQRLPSGLAAIQHRMAAARGNRKLGDLTAGRDARDLVAHVLGEPDVAIESRRDPKGNGCRPLGPGTR